MDVDSTAETLYYYTSGYPFLVSKLCKIINESTTARVVKGAWDKAGIEKAVNDLLEIKNTNFDSVLKNLKNNTDLYAAVEKMMLSGEVIEYNLHSEIINLGIMYGIFKRKDNLVDIHNRIYKELIYNYMTTNFRLKVLLDTDVAHYNFRDNFIAKDGSLDFEKVLLKFQEFMKKEYSHRDGAFIERNGRLVFLAFIKPIINGKGHDFKEVQVSEEKRLDVLITYEKERYVIELKIWRGEEAHQRGIKQLTDYLDILSLDKGFLIIFDLTSKGGKKFKNERLIVGNKDIFSIWV
jgi:hypothetical protein